MSNRPLYQPMDIEYHGKIFEETMGKSANSTTAKPTPSTSSSSKSSKIVFEQAKGANFRKPYIRKQAPSNRYTKMTNQNHPLNYSNFAAGNPAYPPLPYQQYPPPLSPVYQPHYYPGPHTSPQIPPKLETKSDQNAPYFHEGHHHFLDLLLKSVQICFNVIVLGFVTYITYSVMATIWNDVLIKEEEFSQTIEAEIKECIKKYQENQCDPSTRVPHMHIPCLEWEKCMRQDPSVVARGKVTAVTVAEIINSFCEHISYKTMIFFLTGLFVFVASSNLFFFYFRNYVRGDSQPPHHPQQQRPQQYAQDRSLALQQEPRHQGHQQGHQQGGHLHHRLK